ncbi:MAG: 3-isopropylmalate dehydrogenase [Deltaproteobacteria bacterium]|nr:MAG: 3-isopropylmalate dehydrogenase [Deltaproteobacteria bacterium]
MAKAKILVLAGDGIGPEVMTASIAVMEKAAKGSGLKFNFEQDLAGGCSFDQNGTPLTDDVLKKAKKADAVLLGAVGGPKWDTLPHEQRPERALLGLRAGLKLFANLRPAKIIPALISASSLKPEIVGGIDLLVVRELTGGIYFGKPRGRKEIKGGFKAFNTEVYSTPEIERIARAGFEAARVRRKKLTSVDKANILESSILWREVVNQIAKEYPDIQVDHMYVDNCAMQLVRNPKQFDVIVTNNIFGDILSDAAAMLTGSIGMLPSSSLGEKKNRLGFPQGMYEPVHGSAPDIAGKGIANPLATILSCALMLRYSLGRDDIAQKMEKAVEVVLQKGYRCGDIMVSGEEGKIKVGTQEMADAVMKEL